MRKVNQAKRKNRFKQLELPNGYDENCMLRDDYITVKKVSCQEAQRRRQWLVIPYAY